MLFVEGMTIGELDLTNCDMKVVVLQDIVSNPQTSPIVRLQRNMNIILSLLTQPTYLSLSLSLSLL